MTSITNNITNSLAIAEAQRPLLDYLMLIRGTSLSRVYSPDPVAPPLSGGVAPLIWLVLLVNLLVFLLILLVNLLIF